MKRINKNEYRIKEFVPTKGFQYVFAVQKWHCIGWITIKWFIDDDYDFAKREAEELLESLEGGKEIKVKLISK